ncbi:dihydrolipoamide acetyltransferase component of pyruvate dehydrogenase complex [Kocuria dechangensis]|uniref:Dihydrolipoamide acetyltransferase component of pyruvate dehydrogenase complex n=1 Tax=Kocuria dechangensis TaxID=1176249 RepID=A0A917LSE7_9MICC|nr:dihydrolipoamide acetyltransferase family protein [Kocuria dechangensis]GGG52910.1 dihydrolipoamide acetyltransferase component of pyruvate dehydrogenase complex [Kocuria dechangensis]
MTVKTFTLPDLGEGLTEAELVTWLVQVGDTVAVDQPIAEVETAKSAVEVPCPFAGTVRQLHGASGQTLDVGAPLISVDTGAGDGVPAPQGGGPKGGQTYREEERAGADPAAAAETAEDGSGNVLIGYGTPGGGSSGRRRRPKKAPSATPAQAAATGAAHDAMASAPRLAPTVISPIVRKLAKDRGVDISTVRGSGPGGLILRRDVVTAAASPEAAPVPAAAPVAAPVAAPAAEAVDARTGLEVAGRVPVSGVRKVIAEAMTRSRTEIPEATVWVDVDATELVELRAALKARDPENAPGLMALIARFVLAGLARYPDLAARIETREDGSQEIVRFDGVNLGFAAQTDRGLVVPNIRGAHRLSARGLDAELKRLAERARSGKASPAELSGSTFTLNNYGVFGTDGAAAIINHPEVAILGIGRIIDRPWVVDGQLAVRKLTQLSLAFDHRVCDGGVAGGFLRMVADAVENPVSVLADL